MHWIPENSHCESVCGEGGGACCGISLGWNSMHSVPSKANTNFPFKMKVKSFVYPCLVRPLSGIVVVKLQTNDLK